MDDLISRQAAIDALVAETIYTEEELKEYYEANSHRNEWVNGIHEAVEVIKQLPPAQPEPSQVAKDIARILENGQDMRVIAQPERIKGRWVPADTLCGIKCSNCGYPVDDFCYSIDYIDLEYAPNFCPNCGADMREVTT